MKRKLFAVSDVHGHASELMEALREVGFDERNEAHWFVSCGDLFDRGGENARVYRFVRGLERKLLLRGNHEDLLCDLLTRGSLASYDYTNQTIRTVRELLGEDAVDGSGRLDTDKYAARIRELTEWIGSMRDYVETDRYVLTHGWLPLSFEDGIRHPKILCSWRDASAEAWREAHELEWQQLYPAGALLEEKTLVCGHRPAYLGYLFDLSRDRDRTDAFYGDRMIALDADTVNSGRVNVLVLED